MISRQNRGSRRLPSPDEIRKTTEPIDALPDSRPIDSGGRRQPEKLPGSLASH
jgi:hypothetical protein